MAEILIARNVVDLADVGSDMTAPLQEMQANLQLIGIADMQQVVDLAMQVHNFGFFSYPSDESSGVPHANQVNLIMDTRDRDALWELHKQLQACAVVAFVLWEHENFKVPAHDKSNLEALPSGVTRVEEYMVLQRSAPKETYMDLFFTYLAQARAVRKSWSVATSEAV
ncbi:MAG: hypothetical protein AAB557_03975 [Patescibacteria group bacterium]